MRAAFCGSFDPPTLGHLDIIERASALFDELIVLVATNSSKSSMFSMEQRLAWLQEACQDLPNVTCKIQKGLIVQACQEHEIHVLVRGIRNEQDCAYEQNMAFMNAYLDPNIETICLFTKPEYDLFSSSNVRELLKYHQNIQPFVPACVFKSLEKERT
ncbi:pantetheine-phosphate adenylyltransferase [Dubosiella newyorkensis]|uniref:pantetheine-phosphate adenylyltransferase n=1 Tax=Dubosiella newyorkensis TaxID=1862672 RepID=UPI00258B068C|nr:pantetheine-phosphate adenylyltransferase [Dubosiella newyorkensis]